MSRMQSLPCTLTLPSGDMVSSRPVLMCACPKRNALSLMQTIMCPSPGGLFLASRWRHSCLFPCPDGGKPHSTILRFRLLKATRKDGLGYRHNSYPTREDNPCIIVQAFERSQTYEDRHSGALSQSMSGICSLAGNQNKDLKGLETWRSALSEIHRCLPQTLEVSFA